MVKRLQTLEGETRLYLDPRGQIHAVNLTPGAAEVLAELGLAALGTTRTVRLPSRPARRELGFLAGPSDPTSCSTTELWELHRQPAAPDGPLPKLSLKLELARRLATPCVLCHHFCRADRGRGGGWCHAPTVPSEIELVLHAGEEVGGHTLCLYLGPGCSHRCRFCTMHALIHAPANRPLSPEQVLSAVQEHLERGASSLTLIGGEPGIYLPWVLELLALETHLPLVWNSNMYHTPEVAQLLTGIVDVYIADLKFGNDTCARQLAGIRDYLGPVLKNIVRASREGVALVVRHLVMPGHLECCSRPVLEALARTVPGAPVSLFSFIPEFRSSEVGLHRFTTPEELELVRGWAGTLGLTTI